MTSAQNSLKEINAVASKYTMQDLVSKLRPSGKGFVEVLNDIFGELYDVELDSRRASVAARTRRACARRVRHSPLTRSLTRC